MNYITQTQVEQYLGVTLTSNGVNTFNLLLPNMQAMVDLYTNRTWDFTNPVTENFDALSLNGGTLQSQYTFFISKPAISATPASGSYPLAGGVISVTVGNSPIDMNYVVSYGTHVKLSSSFPSVLLANPLGFKMVQVIYNSDAAGNPPAPIKQALIEWIARKIQTAPDANKETTQVHAGTVRAYFKEDADGSMPDFVKLVLDRYRLTPIMRF